MLLSITEMTISVDAVKEPLYNEPVSTEVEYFFVVKYKVSPIIMNLYAPNSLKEPLNTQ